jgi:hypothetical protein
MVNLTEKVKEALTDTKESTLETEEIGELCMACGKDFESKVELQNHMEDEHGA